MKSINRYKFTFGEKTFTLTTDKDNLFMEEVERVAKEKYQAIKDRLPEADDETVAILMAINTLSTQLSREIDIEQIEAEILDLRRKTLTDLQKKANQVDTDEV
ncbi:cell division protein ZapA [Streptococcus castoreus]|uniref:cell division protein ZapA n=1 Tax=Streptococcus castoreus TaxID=254786 RepID=UPI0003FEA34C|nr:cell division protein ZapA [Streptococcus castoreus]